MKQFHLIFFILFLAATSSAAYAETYSWSDEQGTVNFSEHLGSVPQKFRKNARRIEGTESPQEEKAASPPAAANAPDVTLPAAGKTSQQPSQETYGDKTYGQWEKALRDREEAMATVRKNIDEIDIQLSKPAPATSPLWEKRNALSAQFKEMKGEYNQLIESARNAGLIINIEQ